MLEHPVSRHDPARCGSQLYDLIGRSASHISLWTTSQVQGRVRRYGTPTSTLALGRLGAPDRILTSPPTAPPDPLCLRPSRAEPVRPLGASMLWAVSHRQWNRLIHALVGNTDARDASFLIWRLALINACTPTACTLTWGTSPRRRYG